MLSEDERDDLIADNNFQHGRDYERERITALLEAKITELAEDVRFPRDDETMAAFVYARTLNEVIALIKGENK